MKQAKNISIKKKINQECSRRYFTIDYIKLRMIDDDEKEEVKTKSYFFPLRTSTRNGTTQN